VGPHVVDAEGVIVEQLVLNPQEPLLGISGAQVGISPIESDVQAGHSSVRPWWQSSEIRTGLKRKGVVKIGTYAEYWIFNHAGRVRRIETRAIGPQIRERLLVGDTKAATNGGSTFPCRIPRKPDLNDFAPRIGVPHLFHAAHCRGNHPRLQIRTLPQHDVVQQTVGFTRRAENAVPQAKV
jgi:hypothetical protein